MYTCHCELIDVALKQQDLILDDYVLVDTDIALWGALSDAEIVALEYNNTENDDDESEELTLVLDVSRSFFRVHTGYFSNIPKCIKAEFIASWACSQSSVVSSSKR
ncbi:hypothetical protein TNCV_1141511 [Trichonephila clavipes]|nr:hypothetical protein TNCV_1141511 [Trichonephila clavipes]